MEKINKIKTFLKKLTQIDKLTHNLIPFGDYFGNIENNIQLIGLKGSNNTVTIKYSTALGFNNSISGYNNTTYKTITDADVNQSYITEYEIKKNNKK